MFPQPLNRNATTIDAIHWVRKLVRFIGPGFHPDSEFKDYVADDGSRSFTAEECAVLEAGLMQAWDRLDQAGIEIYSVGLPVQRQLLRRERRLAHRAARSLGGNPNERNTRANPISYR